ncbi:hypothetical protein [Holospora obtusa]|uniref:hypothetical protein n=1 Tax=Holospora obtusa TaxID=49893 RepID=UPI000424E993|nr:hypothetical protein [Holospora obtusa]
MFEDSVDDFDLSVGPRMLEFGKPVFYSPCTSHQRGAFCFLASGVAQAVHR